MLAVITGETLAQYKLHWMPTLMSDTQMVLPVEKVMYQAQEVAAVIATDRYAAADGVEAVEVDYEPLPVVVDPFKALEPGAPVLRTDKQGKKDNHIFHWEVGDRAATDEAFRPPPTCGQAAHLPPAHPRRLHRDLRLRGLLRQGQRPAHGLDDHPGAARHPHRLRAGGRPRRAVRGEDPHHLARHRRRLRRQGARLSRLRDRRGRLGRDRQAGQVDRGPHGEPPGRLLRPRLPHGRRAGARPRTARSRRCASRPLADHGYADAAANPSKFPAGLFSICTGSYDFKHAFAEVDGAYTNKPPGGIAYRCSFRVTEAAHAIERMTDMLAQELKMDPAELRFKNFIPPDKFPYKSAARLGVRQRQLRRARCKKAMDMIGYADAAQGAGREARARRADGHRHLAASPRSWAPGPSKHFDILGIKMFDSCEIRVHPTGKAIARFGTKSQGQGHETTYAQIVAEELGIPAAHVQVEEGDTDTAPYGLGTYASRSTPTAGAAGAMAARKIRDKARKIAAHLLEVERGRPGVGAGQVLRQGRAAEEQDHPGDRARRLHQPPAGDGGGAGGASTTTTRRT